MEPLARRELLSRGGRLALLGSGLALGLPAGARSADGPALRELEHEVGTVVTPGEAGYAKARLPWNARFDGIRPLAVVVPVSPAEVKAVIRWARRHDVRLAVRSGGHSYAGLSSTTGVVVDLSRLSGVSVRPDGTAKVGAGIRLRQAYAQLWASRQAISTGSHPTVGLGGLALGGGQGFASRAHGLTCDNVAAIEIVTADGKRRTCSPTAHPDLFWALRGGGAGSYGVVTSFTLRTFAVGNVTTFNIEWPWSAAQEALLAWQAFIRTAPDQISSVLALRVPTTTGGDPKIAVNGQVLAAKSEAMAALTPLTSALAPLRTSIVERPFNVAVKYFEGAGTTRARLFAKSAFAKHLLAPAGADTLIGAVEAKHRDPRLRGGGVVLFAYGGAINRVPPRATAFVHRDARFSLEYVALWNNPSASLAEANEGWVRDVHRAMRPHVSGEAVQNYSDTELAGWRRAYYGQNLARLVAVKKRYDPANVFRHALSIPTRL